jgi:predicted DCC family thiol-disulfide oxidoreductase YuxK
MHAIDADGKWHAGADAFILIWRQINSWRILAMVVSLPIIRQIANVVYRLWAAWRFKRLAHCQLAAVQDVPRQT